MCRMYSGEKDVPTSATVLVLIVIIVQVNVHALQEE